MKLSELESKFGVKFPKKWLKIYDTGAMEWLEIGGEKFRESPERYLSDPKAFLMLNCDCEPLPFDEIPERIDEIQEWISWRTKHDGAVLKEGLTLIPFAMTGRGDLHCFLYEENTNSEPKIILYTHDCFEDRYLKWNDLEQLLYECMLEAADPDYGGDPEDETWQTHLNYLTEEDRAKLIGRTAEDLYDEFLGLPEDPENFENIWEKKQ